MSYEEGFANSYLKKGPPFLGDSSFRDKDAVKANGGRWNSEFKKWEARSREDLVKLLRSKVWLPVGMSQSGAQSVLMVVGTLVGTQGSKKRYPDGFLFDRRATKLCKFNPETDRETLNGHTRVFARACADCCVLLDSRLQFGLECDCAGASSWDACEYCSSPLRRGEACACAPPRKRVPM